VKATWGFHNDIGFNPIGRFFGLMMDGMLGPDYEDGLARLKKVAEAVPPPPPPAPPEPAAPAEGEAPAENEAKAEGEAKPAPAEAPAKK